MNIGTNVRRTLRTTFDRIFDTFYFAKLIKVGLNIDLNRGPNVGFGSGFYFHILWLLFLDCATLWTVFMSWTTWDDPSVDPIYAGNYFRGFGIPKEVFLVIVFCCILNGTVRYYISYLALVDDPHLGHLLQLIRAMLDMDTVPLTVDPFLVSKVRKKMRYLVGFARLFFRTLKISRISMFLFPFASFYLMKLDNLKSWKLVLTLFWSFQWASFADMVITFGAVTLLIIVMISKFFRAVVSEMEQELVELAELEELNRENGHNVLDRKRELFLNHVHKMMQLVQLIRDLNPFLRIIIGSCVLWYSMASLFYIYCDFFVTLPPIFLFIFVYMTLAISPVLAVPLYYVANCSFRLNNYSRSLFKLSDQIGLRKVIKNRINYIIEGINYKSSFDCFKFFPDIDYLFILKVS